MRKIVRARPAAVARRKNPLRITRASKHRAINPRGDLNATWEGVETGHQPGSRLCVPGGGGRGGGVAKGPPGRGFLRDRKGITKDYMKILLSS